MENPRYPNAIDPELMSKVYKRASSGSDQEEARWDAKALGQFIEEANRNAAMYALLAIKARGTAHERTLRSMSEEERQLERRLQADHYLLTGDTFPVKPWHPSAPYLMRAIREQYAREQSRARRPLPPLSDLPSISARHAQSLRDMLAKII